MSLDTGLYGFNVVVNNELILPVLGLLHQQDVLLDSRLDICFYLTGNVGIYFFSMAFLICGFKEISYSNDNIIFLKGNSSSVHCNYDCSSSLPT